MSEPPDWATGVPSTPGVHQPPGGRTFQQQGLPADQQKVLWQNLFKSIIQQWNLAVQGFILPGDPLVQLQSWAGDVPILGDLIEVITGVEDGDLTDLGTWANDRKQEFLDLLGFLWTAFTGLPAGGQTPGDVGSAASAVTDMQAAMAKSVAALKQQLTATQQAAGGNSIAMADDPFDGSGAMTANWDVRYLQPLSGGTVVRNNGQLVWSGFGVTEREVLCRWRGPNPVSLTDYQRVSIVLGSPLTSPSATASDQVVVRCNSAKTTYVKVKFRPTAFILVAVVNDDETVIATQTIPKQAVGTIATVEAGTAVGPRWFRMRLGTVVYDVDDSDAVSQYGPSFRGWGLGMYAQAIIISQVFPGAIDYWQATDNPDMLSPLGDDSTTNYSGGNAASAGLGYISGGDALDAGAGIISGGHA